MQSSNDNNKLFLGIDGGGSKCKAVLVDQSNQVLGEGIAGPANPLHGLEQAINSIIESSQLAIKAAGFAEDTIKDVVAGIGLAGVNIPKYYALVNQQPLPFCQKYLTTDLHIACLGAHQGDGAVIITGTGSCGYTFVNGKELVVGAHGFPQGDKASGAWTGYQAVERALKSMDGIEPPTQLSERVMQFLHCKNANDIVTQVAGKNANFYAKMAGIVFELAENGDEVAVNIIKDGAAYVDAVAEKLLENSPPRLSLIGGLTPLLKPWLAAKTMNQISAPLNPPEIGAVLFAQNLYSASQAS